MGIDVTPPMNQMRKGRCDETDHYLGAGCIADGIGRGCDWSHDLLGPVSARLVPVGHSIDRE